MFSNLSGELPVPAADESLPPTASLGKEPPPLGLQPVGAFHEAPDTAQHESRGHLPFKLMNSRRGVGLVNAATPATAASEAHTPLPWPWELAHSILHLAHTRAQDFAFTPLSDTISAKTFEQPCQSTVNHMAATGCALGRLEVRVYARQAAPAALGTQAETFSCTWAMCASNCSSSQGHTIQ
eukprot:1511360-Amphidinium_carterae.1